MQYVQIYTDRQRHTHTQRTASENSLYKIFPPILYITEAKTQTCKEKGLNAQTLVRLSEHDMNIIMRGSRVLCLKSINKRDV